MAYNYSDINRPNAGAGGQGSNNVGNLVGANGDSTVTLGTQNGRQAAGLLGYGNGRNENPTTGQVVRKDVVDEYLLRFVTRKSVFAAMGESRMLSANSGKTLTMRVLYPILHDLNTGGGGIDQSGRKIADGSLGIGDSLDFDVAGGANVRLDEEGKRQNMVSMKTAAIEGTIYRNGIFAEATTDIMSFHDIKNLPMKEWEEMLITANQIVEFHTQHFLMNVAGIKKYVGVGTSPATMRANQKLVHPGDIRTAATTNNPATYYDAESAATTNSNPLTGIVSYKDIQRMSADLDSTMTPRDTSVQYGSTANDTITLPRTRFAFIDPELVFTLEAMVDENGRKVWRSMEKFGYASEITRNAARFESSGVLEGVVGSIGALTFVAVPRMLRWTAGGAPTTGSGSTAAIAKSYSTTIKNEGSGITTTRYDVYPILTVGSGAFLTINWTDKQYRNGQETRGNMLLLEKKPDVTADDPYASRWIKSVQWWEGFLAHRPERIGLIHTLIRANG